MARRSLAQGFMQAVVNPAVALVLRSPGHRVLSRSLLLLTVRGRKSWREHTLPVQYARAGELIYVLPGRPRVKRWWRNLTGGAPVQLRLDGTLVTAHAEALWGQVASPEMLDGLAAYFRRFPSAARLHRVTPRADGTFDPRDLERAAGEAVVVRIRPAPAA